MSCRLFNVGNTHVLTAGLSSDGTLSDYRVFDTPGFDPEPLLDEENAVVSVVPVWEEYFLKYFLLFCTSLFLWNNFI